MLHMHINSRFSDVIQTCMFIYNMQIILTINNNVWVVLKSYKNILI